MDRFFLNIDALWSPVLGYQLLFKWYENTMCKISMEKCLIENCGKKRRRVDL